ncbi:GntR family transcriptional regulator [Aestuariirhabdus sp. Z084]|uniref:GntR family transcriptional regulator n=1 Tax=Aestuariirhabdus haliotis TaxID=2918751 RepID=UPI00201B43CF|nr:GntR family transcriptional regulator [Aestuariirhabdus haliotis]MCL6414604.1 GntR family transcriptional regulator [Aestuariirhabdus haliotis]MCL6418414.1 GntR family transcriptional regulator [Aestuariirhabdus haliotis]
MAQDIEARTIADRVFESIQTAIVKGDIPPGSKISEPELARTYGISRGPLREAIRRLEGRKLLVRIPHVGARVVSLSAEELLEIYHVRESLEGLACRQAADKMTQEEIEGLQTLLTLHEQQIEEEEGRAYYQKEGDLDFHYRIIQGSKNQTLIQILGGELYHLVRMYRYQFSASGNRPKRAFSEHQQIINAIADRDGELAELLMRRHIAASRNHLEQRVAEGVSQPIENRIA